MATNETRQPPGHTDQVRDHWWWRPGWRVGRRFYTWHLTFDGATDLHQLVGTYQSQLDMPGLDLVPMAGLHLTMQGIGFTDETDQTDVDKIVEAARTRCGDIEPFSVTVGPARVDPEAIMLPATPADRVRQVRARLRAAIGDIWGPEDVPERDEGFTPHVSLAYINTTSSATRLVEAVDSVAAPPVRVTIDSAHLIVLGRDEHLYSWSTQATVPLGVNAP